MLTKQLGGLLLDLEGDLFSSVLEASDLKVRFVKASFAAALMFNLTFISDAPRTERTSDLFP